MSEIKTIEQAADEFVKELNHGLEITMEQKITDVGIFIAGAKHQKELSDAREKLLLDVISEMQNGFKDISNDVEFFLHAAKRYIEVGQDKQDITKVGTPVRAMKTKIADTLLIVAKKLDGLK